jgi:hypothetical protein
VQVLHKRIVICASCVQMTNFLDRHVAPNLSDLPDRWFRLGPAQVGAPKRLVRCGSGLAGISQRAVRPLPSEVGWTDRRMELKA